MNPTTSAAKAPTARPPPIQVRRQEKWGLALSASVASVPCAGHATARRALRGDGVRAIRGALHVGGQPDDGQAREHHAERAGEHPVGKADDFGGGPGRHADAGGRRGPEAERLADGETDRREAPPAPRRVSAGGDGLQHADQLPRLLRAAVRVLGQARHDQLGQRGRNVGADGAESRGVSDMCAASSRAGVLPWNGGRPAISSYAITPNA